MERWKRISMRNARGCGRGFTLVDVLTVLVVLAALVILKPRIEDIRRQAQRDSRSSQLEKPNQAAAPAIEQHDTDVALFGPTTPSHGTRHGTISEPTARGKALLPGHDGPATPPAGSVRSPTATESPTFLLSGVRGMSAE